MRTTCAQTQSNSSTNRKSQTETGSQVLKIPLTLVESRSNRDLGLWVRRIRLLSHLRSLYLGWLITIRRLFVLILNLLRVLQIAVKMKMSQTEPNHVGQTTPLITISKPNSMKMVAWLTTTSPFKRSITSEKKTTTSILILLSLSRVHHHLVT